MWKQQVGVGEGSGSERLQWGLSGGSKEPRQAGCTQQRGRLCKYQQCLSVSLGSPYVPLILAVQNSGCTLCLYLSLITVVSWGFQMQPAMHGL